MRGIFEKLLDKASDIIGKAAESPLGLSKRLKLRPAAAGVSYSHAIKMAVGGVWGIVALISVNGGRQKPL